LDVAFHVQPAGVVETLIDPPVADFGTVVDAGSKVVEQPAPSCDTVSVCPATLIVPLRGALLGFEATLNPRVPLPDPAEGATTVIQLAFDVADHPHAVPAVAKAVLPDPPPALNWTAVGVALNAQAGSRMNTSPSFVIST
jgi:hypothetical protein